MVSPNVLRTEIDGSIWYEMFYLGIKHERYEPALGYACARNGSQDTNWIKDGDNNPLNLNIQLTSDIDNYVSFDAEIFEPGTETYHLWYTAYDDVSGDGMEIKYMIGSRSQKI